MVDDTALCLCDALLAVPIKPRCRAYAIHWKLIWTLVTVKAANSVLLDKRVNETSSTTHLSTTHPSATLDQLIRYYHLTPFISIRDYFIDNYYCNNWSKMMQKIIQTFPKCHFESDGKRNKVHRSTNAFHATSTYAVILPTNPSTSKSSYHTTNNWWKENGLKLPRSREVMTSFGADSHLEQI